MSLTTTGVHIGKTAKGPLILWPNSASYTYMYYWLNEGNWGQAHVKLIGLFCLASVMYRQVSVFFYGIYINWGVIGYNLSGLWLYVKLYNCSVFIDVFSVLCLPILNRMYFLMKYVLRINEYHNFKLFSIAVLHITRQV